MLQMSCSSILIVDLLLFLLVWLTVEAYSHRYIIVIRLIDLVVNNCINLYTEMRLHAMYSMELDQCS